MARTDKKRVNIALTENGHTRLAALAVKMGVTKTAAIELAIRHMAAAEGVPDPTDQPAKPKAKPRRKSAKE
jgi:hypothetical protein